MADPLAAPVSAGPVSAGPDSAGPLSTGPAPGPSPLALRLREATRAAHRSLDHHPLLVPLVSHALTLERYAQALAALHGAHSAIEAALADFAPAALLPPRTPALAADLAALGVAPAPVVLPLPAAAGPAEKLGMLYVIEGSNLGGVAIAKLLATSLPPHAPRAFFGGAQGLPRWQRFWAFAQPLVEPAEFDRVAAAAIATFEFYRRHLDSCAARG